MSDIIEEIEAKFQSSNSVPVERVPLTRNEWKRLRVHMGLMVHLPSFPELELKMSEACKSVGPGNKC